MRTFLLVLYLILPVSSVQAAIYEFRYEADLWCLCYDLADPAEDGYILDDEGYWRYQYSEYWKGSLFFDTSRLPGSTLANTSIHLRYGYVLDEVGEDQSVYQSFSVYNPFGTLSGVWSVNSGSSLDWRPASFLGFTGIFDEFIGFTVGDGVFEISFDSEGNVAYWDGNNMTGGPADPWMGGWVEGNGFFASRSFMGSGPHTYSEGGWTRIAHPTPAPAPVPLPTPIVLLLSGIGALILFRRQLTAAI